MHGKLKHFYNFHYTASYKMKKKVGFNGSVCGFMMVLTYKHLNV